MEETSNKDKSSLIDQATQYLHSPDFLVNFALLPLFFSWYPVLIYKFEDIEIRRHCLRSFINSVYFFVGLFASVLVSKLPFIGDIVATILHFFTVLLYFGISGVLIYSYRTGKRISLAFLEAHTQKVESFL